VIRDLQRGGHARDAAHARERLLGLAERAREVEREVRASGNSPDLARSEDRSSVSVTAIDWHHAKVGDAVQLDSGAAATLAGLPDHRGRVQVRAGSARLTVPVERLRAADAVPSAPRTREPAKRPALQIPNTEAAAATDRCDLRGLRVDEALDQLQAALDRAALGNRGRLAIIHGIGTGALRDAVQRFLRESPYVTRAEPAAPNEGGDGVTIAVL
jgi:DNA mismatch repair protein MutS2